MNQTTGTKQGSLSRSTRLGCPDHHRMAINRQHRRRGQSGPSHVGLAQSVGLSRCRHSRYGFVLAERHVASTFLRPFARRALPRFVALMDALTPGRSALRILMRDNELRPVPSRSPCFMHRIFPPFRLQPPVAASRTWFGFVRELTARSADRIPSLGTRASLGLRHD